MHFTEMAMERDDRARPRSEKWSGLKDSPGPSGIYGIVSGSNGCDTFAMAFIISPLLST